MKAITQILEHVNGKPNPNPQIRGWGDQLKVKKTTQLSPSYVWLTEPVVILVRKQVGGSDPGELLSIVRARLVEQKKARQAATSQAHQVQPQLQAEPLSQPRPAPQPQVRTTQSEQPPQPQRQPTSVAAGFVSPQLSRLNLEALNHTPRAMVAHLNPYPKSKSSRIWYKGIAVNWQRQRYHSFFVRLTHSLSFFFEIDAKRIGDILSVVYVSAHLKQPPKHPDIWVRRTWEMFEVH